MAKYFLIISFTLCALSFSHAQVNIDLPDITYNSGADTLLIPVNVTNFNNIGAISLVIKYDTSAVRFSGIKNSPSHGTFIYNENTNGSIIISWYDFNPINLASGTLLNLVFTNLTGNSALQFETSNCEIADTSLTALPVNYNNGSITKTVLPITLGGNVWLDSNNNGIKDAGEKGVQWVTVDLFKSDGTWLTWQFSDASGNFNFKNYKVINTSGDTSIVDLQPGSYYLEFYLVDSNKIYKFGQTSVGNDPTVNSHAVLITDTTAKTANIDIPSGQAYLYANAGLVFKTVAGVSDLNNSGPKEFSLSQNYPNPFNPSTVIKYSVPESGMVTLKVYDILGNTVTTLVNNYKSAGNYQAVFNADAAGNSLASGIYLYRLVAGKEVITKKMMLVK